MGAGQVGGDGHDAVLGCIDGLTVAAIEMSVNGPCRAIESGRGGGRGCRGRRLALAQSSFLSEAFFVKIDAAEAEAAQED